MDRKLYSYFRPKDSLHTIRDEVPTMIYSEIIVTNETVFPAGKKEWDSFLADRTNRGDLFNYLRKEKENIKWR